MEKKKGAWFPHHNFETDPSSEKEVICNWLIDYLIDWLMIDMLKDLVTYWLIDRLTDWRTDYRLADCFADWLTDSLTYRLTDSRIE